MQPIDGRESPASVKAASRFDLRDAVLWGLPEGLARDVISTDGRIAPGRAWRRSRSLVMGWVEESPGKRKRGVPRRSWDRLVAAFAKRRPSRSDIRTVYQVVHGEWRRRLKIDPRLELGVGIPPREWLLLCARYYDERLGGVRERGRPAEALPKEAPAEFFARLRPFARADNKAYSESKLRAFRAERARRAGLAPRPELTEHRKSQETRVNSVLSKNPSLERHFYTLLRILREGSASWEGIKISPETLKDILVHRKQIEREWIILREEPASTDVKSSSEITPN